MSSATLNPPAPAVSRSRLSAMRDLVQTYFSRIASSPANSWNRTTASALVALVVLWAARLYFTWAAWGNLTIDSGHEMYVPLVLSQGKMLYRDIWFMYGPVAPYFNSVLFRFFGAQLNVLYWAGSLAALGSAIFLYLAGMRLSSWIAGWAAAAVVLIQAFQPSLFCFPLPYSFSAVYGCLTACIFVWLISTAATSRSWGWIFAAGLAAAIALLLKLEFGVACYLTLLILIAARGYQQRSLKPVRRDLLLILPGVITCVLVIRWMISIAGVDFMLQENFMSWPTSYFMKTYGKFWLAHTGFSLTGPAFLDAAFRTALLLGVLQGLHAILFWKHSPRRLSIIRVALSVATLAYLAATLPLNEILLSVFFPKDLVLYVTIPVLAAWFYFCRQHVSNQGLAFALLLTFSALLAFRILLNNCPTQYPIYYNGPATLSFFLLVQPLLSQPQNSRGSIWRVEMAFCLLIVIAVFVNVASVGSFSRNYAPLATERGTVLTSPHLARNYRAAIAFMREKQVLGESVLSVPEDTSLYFLSGTHCPTRVFALNPGMIVPGRMTGQAIAELERENVRYLIWSNRIYPEYGAPRFGVDFDQELGAYLTSHYRSVRPLSPPIILGEWNAYVWERISGAHP
jgi:hypothetical protein